MQFKMSSYQHKTVYGEPSQQPLVALCDDDISARTWASAMVQANGYATLVCDASPASMTIIQRYRPDLVLLDISPNRLISVFQLLDMLHIHPTTMGVPIVLASTSCELLCQQWWRSYDEEYSVIAKPFRATTLLSTIAHHLGHLSPHVKLGQ